MTDRPPAPEDVFHKLDCWRHLPAYRLEPTLAPFFGLFLPDILRCTFEIEKDPVVIPEFPLPLKEISNRKKINDSVSDRNLSVKVDYAVFSKNLKTMFLVELKTDEESFDLNQLDNLGSAEKTGLPCLISGIINISNATNKKRKYFHLAHNLKKAGVVYFCNDLYKKYQHPRSKKLSWKQAFCSIKYCEKLSWETEIIYITPNGKHPDECDLKKVCLNKGDVTKIHFKKVADIVAARGGFGPMFAYYLKRWKSQAGEIDPRKLPSVL